MIQLLIALVLLIFVIGATIFAYFTTPTNLKSYYGKKYLIFIALIVIAIIALVIFGVQSL